MMFWVYRIQSQKNRHYYVGQSDNLQERLDKHNRGEVQSTKSGKPWELKYVEVFKTRSEAVRRERQIKSRKKRKYIEFLIASSERSAAW
jgi:putative endonuclease